MDLERKTNMVVDMQSGYVSAIVVITAKELQIYSKETEITTRVDVLQKNILMKWQKQM
jgi:hypothetical protein